MHYTRTLAAAPIALLLLSGLAFPQEAPPAGPAEQARSGQGGWRRIGTPAQAPTAEQPDPEPIDRSEAQAQAQTPPPTQEMAPPVSANRENDAPRYGVPPELTVKPGTFIAVRINDRLSSDRNQPGDAFAGELMQPLVVDGVVVAQRGQSVYGRVAEAQKARANAPSRLGLEITGITLVDGSQVPLRTALVARQGGREPASGQAGTIIGTTAIGGMVGAAAGWGTGAVIGAGAGAAVGAVAVLLTRNRPSVIYPETALTFRIESPLAVSTVRAPQAFRYAGPEDYSRPLEAQARPMQRARPCYGCAPPPPYWGPAYSPYPSWGPYWGPYYGVGVVIGGGRYRRWR